MPTKKTQTERAELLEKALKVEEKTNYSFRNQELLLTALTHKSYTREAKECGIPDHNERLEFLGDAVLELIVTDYLFHNFTEPEGYLTSLRASLVNYKTLAKVGRSIDLQELIFISQTESEELGKARDSIVADGVEALIGAMHIDGGYTICKQFIHKHVLVFLPFIIEKKLYTDYKTKFQEMVQRKHKITPNYRILESVGKDHNKIFTAGVYIQEELVSKGSGKSKQQAQTEAAKKAYLKMSTSK